MALENISDTARWVAMYRALESERPDALFRDPFARRLAGERGEQALATVPKARTFAWPMIVRTAVMDELLMRLVREGGVDRVLNLAAGLDTRPYRLELPAELEWFEVDLPEILAYKGEMLAGETPVCRLERVALDLRRVEERRALFARIGERGGRLAVITEGLLVYLEREEVAALAADLHAAPSFGWWIIDLVAPELLRRIQKMWGSALSAANAPMKFAPAEGTAFFAPHGWKEIEFRSTFEEAHRLRREMSLAWLWRAIGRLYPARKREQFRRMGGVVLLERT